MGERTEGGMPVIQVHKDGAWMRIDPVGAQMIAYCDKKGKQRLWSGDPDLWDKVAPILFPAIGAIKDGQVRFAGKAYPLSRHGFVREAAFEVREVGEDFCVLALRDSQETQQQYPFSFVLTVTHRLLPEGFVTEMEVENTGSQPMPFALGGHPGFACPMEEGEAFSDYIVRFEKPEEGRSLLCMPHGLITGEEILPLGPDNRTLALRYEDYDRKDTLIFAGLRSRSVELVHRETGKGLRFSFPNSPVLALWTMPHQHVPYLCLEPWNGLPAFADETGDFEDKPYHVTLGAGERFSLAYGMEALD